MDERVAKQAAEAGGDALWRALQPLRSTATWLMFGAHPDDEWNGFLAWLALGRGIRAVYACATRGDGGQNALGPERGADLAALRSREMECAAREIGFGVRWLTPGGDDPVRDFGFSRSAEDTLARWGERRLVERMARAIREVRPDAVSPTFLDVPGQHGHHRAVTRSLASAMALAADPGWRDAGAPRRVAHAYLPAFSGGGGTYDDEVPPPPATIAIDLGTRSDVLGASWAQLGEWSRRFHATQGMGRWLPDGSRPMALHKFAGPPDRGTPLDAERTDVANLVPDAAAAIEDAVAAWPDRTAVANALHRAIGALDRFGAQGQSAWLLARKRREAARAWALALGISPRLTVVPDPLRPGTTAEIVLAGAGGTSVAWRVPSGWPVAGGGGGARVDVPAEAAPLGTMRDGWEPLGGNDIIGATLTWARDGTTGRIEVDPDAPLVIEPAVDVTVVPDRVVRRLADLRPAVFAITGTAPPPSWHAERAEGADWRVPVPPGRTDLPPVGARLASMQSPLAGRAARIVPASAATLGVDAAIDPDARVGVVAGETDATLGWLHQLGIKAVALDDAALAAGTFDGLTTVLVGVFAYRQRPALAEARPALLRWIERGGSLVTLYHRPIDAWEPDATPPRRLFIGAPSFRWRVTDPAAPIRILAPDASLLHLPNVIAAADWAGWVRERGLYFASAWDDAYRPLLELSDPGEPALRGALLEAAIGRGRHIHVALALHHQWEELVPGAFRLLANLVARPD